MNTNQSISKTFSNSNLQLQSNIKSSMQDNKIVPIFLSRFINDSFIENMINICLYQSDFTSLSARPMDVVNFMNKFLMSSILF